jgi:GDP-4-dehydro-6-deoxy-D-mannose reductase
MSILVTGASGFVGSHLLDYLKHRTGLTCYGLSRQHPDKARMHFCDLADRSRVDETIRLLKPDLIFHMAGSFSNDFVTDLGNNVLAARHLLDAVVAAELPARILLMGSAAEYGDLDPDQSPVAETQALRPVSVYGWTKAAQSQLASLYASTFGLDVMVARTFNLLGRGVSEKLFIGNVQKQIDAVQAGKRDRISVGSLDAERDYINIADACALYHAISTNGVAGEVYNVGSGKPVTMRVLLRDMLRHARLDESIVDEDAAGKPTTHAQVSRIYADISKLNALNQLPG